MSTPDPSGLGSADATPAVSQAASAPSAPGLQTPISPASPGIALAGARVPGGPTLPDWDPSTMAASIAQMANELFAAPPNGGGSTFAGAMPDAPPAGALPAQGFMPAASSTPREPVTPEILGTAPVSPPSSSPFFAPPNFDLLVMLGAPGTPDSFDLSALRFPLLDAEAIEGTSAYFLPAEDPTGLASPTTGMPTETFQVEPTVTPPPDPAPELPGSTAGTAFDPYSIRREFPILEERIHGKRLVWLDNAATTQKPRVVIDRISEFYRRENSNVHRAAHTLAARATDAYESARKTVRRFLNAPSGRNIVFVRGATEGINLIAQSWGRRNIEAGDEIVITWLEHHANIVPWQMLCSEKGARLRVAPVDDRGQILLEEYEKILGPKTRLVALPQVSNALGTIAPAREMVEMAHRHGARVLVDGAQTVSHMRVDVQQLDCDFYVFSGHKVFAPTGIGVVFGKSSLLDAMPPWQGGGNMIEDVTFEKTTYQPAPARFEAGTGNIADAVGLGAALDWLSRLGLENVARHEHDLLVYGTEKLSAVPGLTIIGTALEKAGVISFILAGQNSQEVAAALDQEGIAVRGGHHCAQPILRRFGVESTVRASFAPYNVREDIDALTEALHRLSAGRDLTRD